MSDPQWMNVGTTKTRGRFRRVDGLLSRALDKNKDPRVTDLLEEASALVTAIKRDITTPDHTPHKIARDHGYYWIIVNDGATPSPGGIHEQLAEWAYLCAVGKEVWFAAGREDYYFDEDVIVRSGRQPEPSMSLKSKVKCWLGFRDERLNCRYY